MNVTNSTDHVFHENSTSTTISLHLTNGSYTYSVSTSDKIYSPSPSSGSFTVKGAVVSESVTFTKYTYRVNFTESGLPSGSTWYVNLSNGMSSGAITGSSYNFTLTNGSYTFTITNLSSYYTTTSHLTVTVNGSNVTETVHYYHWAYITGTISPVNATLTINGKAVTLSSSGSFNISLPNGTYHVIVSETGYSTYYDNFTLNSSSVKSMSISLNPISKPSTTPTKPSSISSTEIYIIIGAIAAVAVIGGVVVVIRRKK